MLVGELHVAEVMQERQLAGDLLLGDGEVDEAATAQAAGDAGDGEGGGAAVDQVFEDGLAQQLNFDGGHRLSPEGP